VVFKHLDIGVWRIHHFTRDDYDYVWVWITPTTDVPPCVASLGKDAMIGVHSKQLTPYTLTGEPIHGL
jgi:hypothetical protein